MPDDAKGEVCGGAREALTIRRTLKSPHPKVSRSCAHSAHPPASVVVIAPAPNEIRLKSLLLATLVIATYSADLKPGVRI